VIARLARVRPEVADALLEQAEQVAIRRGAPPPARDLQQAVKRNFRDVREVELAAATQRASRALGSQVYSVILADPPWRFEPRSRETGMDRAADNHYPTMSLDDIMALKFPAAKNCVLGLWRSPAWDAQAVAVAKAWGFETRSEFIWDKETSNYFGYWIASQHETLMICIKGRNVPAPAPGTQYPSIIRAPRGRHSEKPDVFYEMFEKLFPNQPKLEMFARRARRARRARQGWDRWGNEAPLAVDAA